MKNKFPIPKVDRKAYRSEMILGFLKCPKRLWNFIKYKFSERGMELNYLPIKLDIENVSRCNFRCTMCQISDWDNYKRAEDMSLDVFKQLIDSQYGLYEIKLQGVGEPLLHPDFFKMVKYARERHIWVRVTTNGSLLHLNDNYKRLIDSDINEVIISIDGTTKEVFEKIRRGADFKRIKENCKLINDYCNSKNLLKTRMWTVLQKENLHQICVFPRLAKDLNFKRLSLSLNLTDWGQESWLKKNREISVYELLEEDKIQETMRLGADLGVEVSFWNIATKYSPKKKQTLCPWPFERSYISSDMRIVPCCKIANPDVVDFGKADNFEYIWRNGPYKNFRLAHLQGKVPPYCKSCYE